MNSSGRRSTRRAQDHYTTVFTATCVCAAASSTVHWTNANASTSHGNKKKGKICPEIPYDEEMALLLARCCLIYTTTNPGRSCRRNSWERTACFISIFMYVLYKICSFISYSSLATLSISLRLYVKKRQHALYLFLCMFFIVLSKKIVHSYLILLQQHLYISSFIHKSIV
jgi:hypothetical protein